MEVVQAAGCGARGDAAVEDEFGERDDFGDGEEVGGPVAGGC
ncbi:hypothetical protein AB0F46_41110 [Streptomyces sp. NPDC026665]